MKQSILIAIIIGVVIIFIIAFNSSEGFGQDPTTRAQVGWLAGPKGLYGYDPVVHFADQIEAMKNRENQYHNSTFYPDVKHERYTKNHDPRFKNCRISSDCWEGERCYVDKCIPTTAETYSPSQEKKKCKSCMTTEDFEAIE